MKFNNKNRVGLLLLGIALIIGSFVRLYKLGQIPVSLYWDEVAIGYGAYSLSLTAKDMHGHSFVQAMFPSYGDYKLPMYIWIDALAVKAFGPTPFAVRLPSALAGIGLIFLAYLISLQLFKNNTIAGFAAFSQALLPTDILFSRTGFEGHLAVFFVALTIYIWLRSRTRSLLVLLSAFTAAAAVYSYFSARIVLPIMGVATFITFFTSTTWRWRGLFIVSMGLFFVLLIPIFKSPYYEASNRYRLSTANLSDSNLFIIPSNIAREQSGNNIISRVFYHHYVLQAKAIASHIAAHFDPRYLFISGDENLRHSTRQVGLLFIGFLPLFIVGWAGLIKKQRAIGIWILCLWLASILPSAIPMEVPHALRSMDAIVIFPIVISFGVYLMIKNQFRWVMNPILLVVLLEAGLFAHDYLAHYPARSASSWQYGYEQLTTNLHNRMSEYDRVIVDYPDWRLYLSMLFFQKIDPRTLPIHTDFIYKQFGTYSFSEIKKLSPDVRTLMVLSPERHASLMPSVYETLYDYEGKPEFYLVKGGQ